MSQSPQDVFDIVPLGQIVRFVEMPKREGREPTSVEEPLYNSSRTFIVVGYSLKNENPGGGKRHQWFTKIDLIDASLAEEKVRHSSTLTQRSYDKEDFPTVCSFQAHNFHELSVELLGRARKLPEALDESVIKALDGYAIGKKRQTDNAIIPYSIGFWVQTGQTLAEATVRFVGWQGRRTRIFNDSEAEQVFAKHRPSRSLRSNDFMMQIINPPQPAG